jgi:hypothetical protein
MQYQGGEILGWVAAGETVQATTRQLNRSGRMPEGLIVCRIRPGSLSVPRPSIHVDDERAPIALQPAVSAFQLRLKPGIRRS